MSVLGTANPRRALLLALVVCAIAPLAHSASCTTQAQMTDEQRNALSNAARSLIGIVQSGDVQTLRSKTLPVVAADFSGIASSIQALAPLVQHATVTVDEIYALDASKNPTSGERTQFFCGSPTTVLTFDNLPGGTYALSILHATGVPKPQQISLVLARAPDNSWQLAGLYAKPMVEAGHDGLWYWRSARKYAQSRQNWNAWIYYRLATALLDPLDLLSSPNLEKLQREAEQIHPPDAPGASHVTLNINGATYTLTKVDATTEFGPLDIDLHYAPDPSQAAQLRTPVAARQQVTNVMTALLAQHPELRDTFHGIWVHADQGNTTLFALELAMSGITPSPSEQTPAHPLAR